MEENIIDSSPIHGFVILNNLSGIDKSTAEVSANLARLEMGHLPKSMEFVKEIPKLSLWKRMLFKGLLNLSKVGKRR